VRERAGGVANVALQLNHGEELFHRSEAAFALRATADNLRVAGDAACQPKPREKRAFGESWDSCPLATSASRRA
jgi:hypothetical protein